MEDSTNGEKATKRGKRETVVHIPARSAVLYSPRTCSAVDSRVCVCVCVRARVGAFRTALEPVPLPSQRRLSRRSSIGSALAALLLCLLLQRLVQVGYDTAVSNRSVDYLVELFVTADGQE